MITCSKALLSYLFEAYVDAPSIPLDPYSVYTVQSTPFVFEDTSFCRCELMRREPKCSLHEYLDMVMSIRLSCSPSISQFRIGSNELVLLSGFMIDFLVIPGSVPFSPRAPSRSSQLAAPVFASDTLLKR